MASKPCRKCGATERYKDGRCKTCTQASSTKWRAEHPEQYRSYQAKYYAEHPEQRRASAVKQLDSRHGFSPSIVAAMKLAQGGRCAICRVLLTEGKGPSSVHRDHCHECDLPRGLLCSVCNRNLGDYELFQRSAGLRIGPYDCYLQGHELTPEHTERAQERKTGVPVKSKTSPQLTIFDCLAANDESSAA